MCIGKRGECCFGGVIARGLLACVGYASQTLLGALYMCMCLLVNVNVCVCSWARGMLDCGKGCWVWRVQLAPHSPTAYPAVP